MRTLVKLNPQLAGTPQAEPSHLRCQAARAVSDPRASQTQQVSLAVWPSRCLGRGLPFYAPRPPRSHLEPLLRGDGKSGGKLNPGPEACPPPPPPSLEPHDAGSHVQLRTAASHPSTCVCPEPATSHPASPPPCLAEGRPQPGMSEVLGTDPLTDVAQGSNTLGVPSLTLGQGSLSPVTKGGACSCEAEGTPRPRRDRLLTPGGAVGVPQTSPAVGDPPGEDSTPAPRRFQRAGRPETPSSSSEPPLPTQTEPR